MRRTRCVRGALVSLRFAPSFVQPPASVVVGKATRDIPSRFVTAYVDADVITADEERALLARVRPWFARLPLLDGHFDGLIHHYAEFYRSYDALMRDKANTTGDDDDDANTTDKDDDDDDANKDDDDDAVVRAALSRVRAHAQRYVPHIPLDDRVHFLRLAGSGFIRAHVDDTRNSSGIVAGLCLGSARVMTLTRADAPGERVELLLAPRCVYAMIGPARYAWQHSVDWTCDDDEHVRRVRRSHLVDGSPVVFDGAATSHRRGDRVAVIFRGVPPLQLLAQRRRETQKTA